MFQSFQSFLAFLFALLTVYTLIRAFRLDSLLDPARDFWKRIGKVGRVCATISVVFLAGHAVSKELLRGGGGNANLPDWFIALQYNPADTDGDGIPDCWERWTRTKPLIADANLDPDGDGVDNFGEFWNQCDPLMKDTDGDGYSDKLEIEGRAAGKTWFNPIVRAVYEYNDPDVNTNGVPDRWEGLGYVYGYTDANHDGLPDGVSFPEYGGGNFEIEVIVTTTRAALLSWGSSTKEAIVLPPCSCLPVRLRLSGFDDTDIRLSCGTAGDGSEGLWYGRLVIRWPEDCGYETEGDRILVQADSILECEAMEVSFRGEVQTEPQRTPQGDVPTSIKSPFRRKWLHVYGFFWDCWEHGFGTNAVAMVTYTNVAPPFAWYVNDNIVRGSSDDILTAYEIFNNWNGESPIEVRCEWTNSVFHQSLRVEGADIIECGHCPPSATNILPITSLSGYDVMTNHVPDFKLTPNHYGSSCPETTTLDICAGYAHGGEKPWERNFETIPTGSAEDDETSHCHSIDWSENIEIDLEEYLPDWLLDYKDKLRFRVDGEDVENSKIPSCPKPADLNPRIFHVELCNDAGCTLDRLWIIVLNPNTRIKFNTWLSENTTNATWLSLLPKPPSKLTVASGVASLPSAASANWNAPETFPTNNFMHPKAVYELRSISVGDAHGHQATYDASGMLITDSIKAGTADIATPYPVAKFWRPINHREKDVKPYIRALQLDGNPIYPVDTDGTFSENFPRNISRPPLRVDFFTRQYLERRPTIPTGVLNIP